MNCKMYTENQRVDNILLSIYKIAFKAKLINLIFIKKDVH